MMQIELQEPEWYMDRLSQGLILDPSVFYSAEHVEAVSMFIKAMQPKEVFIPSSLYDALTESQWLKFSRTLTLWSAKYEDTSAAWYATDSLLQFGKLKPIPEPEPNKFMIALQKHLQVHDRALFRTVYELTAHSIQNSLPILACQCSSFRLAQLLSSRIETVVVEPAGRWKNHKRETLRKYGGNTLLLLRAAQGALLFLGAAQTGSGLVYAGAGITVAITVIDG